MANNRTHKISVVVKDTKNDPGHVSVFITDDANNYSHTSFLPRPLGSLINAITLSSIPVRGMVNEERESDLSEAQHVLTKNISHADYLNARAEQQRIAARIANGTTRYSVFGSHPVSCFFASILTFYRGAEQTQQAFQERTGIHLFATADSMDNTMEPLSDLQEAHPIQVENCISISNRVLRAAGVNINSPFMPTLFTPLLKEQGFDHQPIQNPDNSCKQINTPT